jgi:tetratricopeptide (TPR) repeat protein
MTRAAGGAEQMRLAEAHLAAGRFTQAIEILRVAARLERDSSRPRLMLAFALASAGEREEAIRVLKRLTDSLPRDADAWFNLGNLYRSQRRLEDAARAFKRAASLRPNDANPHINLAYVLVLLGRFEEAEATVRAALPRFPDEPDLLVNLAQLQRATHRLTDAIHTLDRCVALSPGHAGYRVTRAMVLRDVGRKDEALAELDRLIREHPDFPDGRSARAQVFLSRGQCEAAWRDFLWRPERTAWLKARGLAPAAPAPTADEVRGRSVLVHGEQGLGDVVFFLRFAPRLAEVASSVHLNVDARLLRILPEQWQTPAPGGAFSLPVGDLANLFGAAPVPSLRLQPQPERQQRMRERLSRCGPPPYIAVTWQGGYRWEEMPEPGSRLFKRVPPESLGEALRDIPGTLVSVQRNPAAPDLDAISAAANRTVHDFSFVNEELPDAMAVLSLAHDYIAVSNTNVHLNDALGRRTRVLVTHPPEWRWSTEGDRSPWLTHALLYRQAADGSWREALARLRHELAGK